jgi:hypothetical protein
MSKIQFEKILFMYRVGNEGDMWIYTEGQYHRFSFKNNDIRYIRSQRYLPVYAEGTCFYLSRESVRQLEKECHQHHITLRFFNNLEECQEYAAAEHQFQYTFDKTPPAGYFYLGKGIEKQFGEGSEE